MPNIPAAPGSTFDRKYVAIIFGTFGGLICCDVTNFMLGLAIGLSTGVACYIVIGMSPYERTVELKKFFPPFIICFVITTGLFLSNSAPQDWGGGGNQLYFVTFYFSAAVGGMGVIVRHWKRVSREGEPSPVPTFAAPTPTPPPPFKDAPFAGAREAQPAADPFAFDAARFEAARAAPEAPPSFFLTQVKKLEVDLSSDREARAFAGALNTQAKSYIVHKLDEEIADPNTSPELRQFLLRVRAYLLGQAPIGDLPSLEDKR